MVGINVSRSGRLIGLALAVSILGTSCRGGEPAAGQGPPPMPVEIQVAKGSTVEESSEFVGQLEAQKRVVLRPEAAGRVVQIFVSSGQRVQAGTPVVQLKADRSQAEERGAIADVAAARASFNTARAQVSAAEADLERATADVRLQESEYQRTSTLVREGALSRQELDRVRNRRDTAIAAQRAAQEQVTAARASLAEANADVVRSQADRAVATEDVQDRQVNAPIAGVVGNVPIKLGDYVTTDTTLTSIIQNDALVLNISVPIERSAQLRVGVPVELLDEQNNPVVQGRISFVSPEVNANDQAVLAKASFPNNGTLRDGQFVRTRVVWSRSPGLLVPTAAVTRVAGQTFVYVAEQGEAGESGQPQQVARQRAVKLGNIQGNSYQVISGIEAGDQVIVSGVLNLSDGAPIAIGQPGDGQSPGQSSP